MGSRARLSRQHGEKYIHRYTEKNIHNEKTLGSDNMTWQRHRTPASYSSSTLSSTSSGTSSTGTYASIKSVSSCASRLSSQLQPSNFWNKFDRKTKTYSVLSVLKNIFKHKERGEPSKLSKENLQIYHITPLHSE